MQQQSLARRLGRWVPLIGWMLFISIASSNEFSAANTSLIIGPLVLWLSPNTSPETLNIVHVCVRKLAHLTEYAILGILAARALRTSTRQIVRTWWFQISLCLVIVYALLDEYHQSFVPSRTSSIFDSMIDAIGGLAALLVIRFRTRRKHSSNLFESAYNHGDPNNLSNE
jgi:VanZ family protein